jgi:hypothetical protein
MTLKGFAAATEESLRKSRELEEAQARLETNSPDFSFVICYDFFREKNEPAKNSTCQIVKLYYF